MHTQAHSSPYIHARRSRVLPIGWHRLETAPATFKLPTPSFPQPGRQQGLPVQLELDEFPKAAAVVIPQCARIPYRSHLCLYHSHMFRVLMGQRGCRSAGGTSLTSSHLKTPCWSLSQGTGLGNGHFSKCDAGIRRTSWQRIGMNKTRWSGTVFFEEKGSKTSSSHYQHGHYCAPSEKSPSLNHQETAWKDRI